MSTATIQDDVLDNIVQPHVRDLAEGIIAAVNRIGGSTWDEAYFTVHSVRAIVDVALEEASHVSPEFSVRASINDYCLLTGRAALELRAASDRLAHLPRPTGGLLAMRNGNLGMEPADLSARTATLNLLWSLVERCHEEAVRLLDRPQALMWAADGDHPED